MEISKLSGLKKSPSKLSKIFNALVSILISIIGVAFLIQSIIGGFLIIFSGLIFSFAIKNRILEKFNVKFITTRLINVVSIIFFIVGSIYAMNESDEKNKAVDWEKNNIEILTKISQQLDDGNLSGANFDLKKYESVAKNDPTFIELKENYQKQYNAAEELKKKEREAKQKQLEEQKKAEAAASNVPNGKLIYYKDSGSTSNNITISQYRYACKKSWTISNESIRIQGAANGLIRTIIDTNGSGSIKNKFITWNEDEQVCVGLFDIVGTYNGTTYNKKYGGYIYTFENNNGSFEANIGGIVSEVR